jgi:hypothetical protein
MHLHEEVSYPPTSGEWYFILINRGKSTCLRTFKLYIILKIQFGCTYGYSYLYFDVFNPKFELFIIYSNELFVNNLLNKK